MRIIGCGITSHLQPSLGCLVEWLVVPSEGDEKVVPAFVAVGAGEAVSQNSAVEITPKGLLDIGGNSFITRSVGECQPSFEVRLHGAIPEGFLESATLIALGWRCDTFDGGIHDIPHWAGWIGVFYGAVVLSSTDQQRLAKKAHLKICNYI